jgi:hypothetical protein
LDKTPKIVAWEQNATKNTLKIEATWQIAPQFLPGLPVGAHGLVVIDCDRKPNAPDGVETFKSLCAAHSIDLSGAFVVETPSTGLHFYFRTDTPYGNSSGTLPAGIDVRGVGGYVIAPGATLPDGRSYKLMQGSWEAIPLLPVGLAAFLRPKAESPLPTPVQMLVAATERERHYGATVLEGCLEEISALTEGERNNKVNAIAYRIFRQCAAGRIDTDNSENEILRVSLGIGLSERAVRDTIKSAKNAGLVNPAEPLAELPQWIPAVVAKWIEAYKARNPSAAPVQGDSGIELVSFADIEERAVDWLWGGFIPKGKLLLLAGTGGSGKGTIVCSFAAAITNAGLWPDHSQCGAATNVLIWSSEDDPYDTIKPRLIAANANVHRCRFIQGKKDEKGNRRSFDPSIDMERLSTEVANLGNVSMVVIDPIVQAVRGDMYRPNEVRRALQPIVDFAARFNCAVIGITHITKRSRDVESVDRILGSTTFKDFARGALMVGRKEGTNNRVMVRAKSNLGQDSGGFSFTLEILKLHRNIETSRVKWGEFIDGSARSILAKIEGDDKEDGEKMKAAKQFLIEMLSNGPAPAKELLNHAREGYGITEDTLRRAYKDIGTKPSRVGFGANGGWMWALPFTIHRSRPEVE